MSNEQRAFTFTKQADSGFEEQSIEFAKRDMTWFDGTNFESIWKLWELEMSIFKIEKEDMKLRFVFQRLRQSIRMKVSADVSDLDYNTLVRYLRTNYGIKRKITLQE